MNRTGHRQNLTIIGHTFSIITLFTLMVAFISTQMMEVKDTLIE